MVIVMLARNLQTRGPGAHLLCKISSTQAVMVAGFVKNSHLENHKAADSWVNLFKTQVRTLNSTPRTHKDRSADWETDRLHAPAAQTLANRTSPQNRTAIPTIPSLRSKPSYLAFVLLSSIDSWHWSWTAARPAAAALQQSQARNSYTLTIFRKKVSRALDFCR